MFANTRHAMFAMLDEMRPDHGFQAKRSALLTSTVVIVKFKSQVRSLASFLSLSRTQNIAQEPQIEPLTTNPLQHAN